MDLWKETVYPTLDEIKEKEKIKQQLEDFQTYPEF